MIKNLVFVIFAFASLFSGFACFAAEGEIKLQSVLAEPAKEEAPLPESALFTLEGEDIVAWEDHPEQGLLYFEISAAKNEELALLATENRGKPMQINFGQDFVIVPQIGDDFLQKGGFILPMADSERQEFIYSMLERPKKRQDLTPLSLGKKEAAPGGNL